MKQIARATRLFTDKLKYFIVAVLILILVPSFAISQNLIPKQENKNTTTEDVVPKTEPPKTTGPLPYGAMFMLKKPIACNDTPILLNYIQGMNQMVPVTMGTDRNPMGGITSLVQIYANPVTENFAIVEHFAIKKSCIIFQGHDFDIILPEPYFKGQLP